MLIAFFKAEGIADVYNPGDPDRGREYAARTRLTSAISTEQTHTRTRLSAIIQKWTASRHTASWAIMTHRLSSMFGLDISRTIAKSGPICDSWDGPGVHPADAECTLELRHPGGGSAYALSYKPQKIIESMSGGEKPNILLLGHFHKGRVFVLRNVHCVQAGTTQAQSNFMRNHNLAAHMGYWLVEIHVNDDGQINRFRPEFMPCYRAIKDDWKEWR